MKKRPEKPIVQKKVPSTWQDLVNRPFGSGLSHSGSRFPGFTGPWGDALSPSQSSNDGSTNQKIIPERAFTWVIKKDNNGKYYYHGQEIVITTGTESRRALDALIEVADKNGVALFPEIDKHMVLLGSKGARNERLRNIRISHCVGEGQGFFHFGRLGQQKKRLKDVIVSTEIIRSIPGEGYQLINP